ncbi:NUDIX domain-containing protein [Ramlibacter sp. MMS24-I3-19]|uniref:NUDIX domain-containing protein n=1 Tax=Ramlibacter sp. MMS24-I3-19 TaxID=3416606 RepID=UPI003D02CB6D
MRAGLEPLPPEWRATLRARLVQPPARPRVGLWWQDAAFGSVESAFVARLHAAMPATRQLLRAADEGFRLHADVLTPALAQLATSLREAGLAHVWRDEQLPVTAADGRLLGTIERAVVRPLGVATRAVHLVGWTPDGRQWVQQRSHTKANDPGQWDTLMGGMVPASDSLEQALARETWEEAGLRLEQLQDLRWGGQVHTARPAGIDGGYVREVIDWYRCTVPVGLEPINQDGEVQQFRAMSPTESRQRLLAGDFTLEAAGVMAADATGM